MDLFRPANIPGSRSEPRQDGAIRMHKQVYKLIIFNDDWLQFAAFPTSTARVYNMQQGCQIVHYVLLRPSFHSKMQLCRRGSRLLRRPHKANVHVQCELHRRHLWHTWVISLSDGRSRNLIVEDNWQLIFAETKSNQTMDTWLGPPDSAKMIGVIFPSMNWWHEYLQIVSIAQSSPAALVSAMPSIYASIPAETKANMSWTQEEMIDSVDFEMSPVDVKWAFFLFCHPNSVRFSTAFTPIVDEQLGNCFTFNYANKTNQGQFKARLAGQQRGLFKLWIDSTWDTLQPWQSHSSCIRPSKWPGLTVLPSLRTFMLRELRRLRECCTLWRAAQLFWLDYTRYTAVRRQ